MALNDSSLAKRLAGFAVAVGVFSAIIGVPSPSVPYEAPVTQLNLRLIGLNTGSSPFAIIEDTHTHKQNVFELHDQISGAEIIAIEPEYVLLQRNDNLERLPVKQGFRNVEDGADSGQVAAQQSDGQDVVANNDQIEPETVVVSKALIDQQWQQLPQQMFQSGISPVVRDGAVAGLSIGAVPDNSIISMAGLHSGDVLKSINGVKVSDPLQLLTLLDSGQINPNNVQLELERDGSPKTVNFSAN